MAKYAGIVVLIATGVIILSLLGPALIVIVVAALTVFAVAWAIGAIIYNDWWPFRHL